jgi:hypothetical protein
MIQSVVIGDKTFVSGLTWRILDGTRYKQERPTVVAGRVLSAPGKVSRRMLQEESGRYATWHQTDAGNLQIGISTEEYPNAYSLAQAVYTSVMANHQTDTFAAMFEHDGAFFTVICIDGLILDGDGDNHGSADSAEDMRASFLSCISSLMPSSADALIIAPDSMSIPGAREASLELVIEKAGQLDSCRLLTGAPKRLPIVAAFAAIIAAAYGYSYFQDYQLQKQMEELRARAMQQSAQPEEVIPTVAYEPASAFVDHCVNEYRQIDPYESGWRLREVVCTEGALNAVYDRQGARTQWFIDRHPDALIDITGNTAELLRSVETSRTEMLATELPDIESAALRFNQMAQDYGLNAALSESGQPIAQLPGREGTVPVASYRTFTWSISSAPSLEVMKSIVPEIPGFGLQRISISTGEDGSQAISLEGVMYVKN